MTKSPDSTELDRTLGTSRVATAGGAWRWPILAALLLACVVAWRFGGSSPHASLAPLHDSEAASMPITEREDLGAIEKRTIALVENARKSVVSISVYRGSEKISSGSGIFWDSNGNVVTNWHVIRKALTRYKRVSVTPGFAIFITRVDQKSVAARVVGVQPSSDLAVLRADFPKGAEIQPLRLGSVKDLRVGQMSYAIGNPYGYDFTLTTGVVSALGRRVRSVTERPIEGVIQTEAAINPGNSGGPLLDSSGRLIGITTSIHSPSGTSIGLGFAIPVDLVNRVVPQLIRGSPRSGIGVIPASPFSTRYLRMFDLEGVAIRKVVPGTSAEKAGLRAMHVPGIENPSSHKERLRSLGDIIVGVDGVRIKSIEQLDDAIRGLPVGKKIDLAIVRDGVEKLVLPIALCNVDDPGA